MIREMAKQLGEKALAVFIDTTEKVLTRTRDATFALGERIEARRGGWVREGASWFSR